MGQNSGSLIVFILGVALFALGVWLVQDLILKFLKFAVGLFLIFISLPMMIGGVGFWRYFKRRKVVRIHRH